ncbi:RpiB/LacA/LacB family sugar-phosphate isomerase, partial [Streptococcus suis]
MKIGIGSDHNAYDLKEYINTRLLDAGHEIVDFGCYSKDT